MSSAPEHGELTTTPGAALSTEHRDPTTDWPTEATALRTALTELFGPEDPLPGLGGTWVAAARRSQATRRARTTAFLMWARYCHAAGVHPLQAKPALATAYANWLGRQTVERGKNAGKPYTETTIAQRLSVASSFYRYTQRTGVQVLNVFDTVERPAISADYSPTVGLSSAETAALIAAAREDSPRAYVIVLVLYLTGMRISELLDLDVTDQVEDSGHSTVPITLKGGRKVRVPLPPAAAEAIAVYLDGRETGPLLATRNGLRIHEAEVQKVLQRVGRKAGIASADLLKPHTLRHAFITESLEAGIPLQTVQDAVGHADPRTTQRYNRRRRSLDSHPGYRLAANIPAAAPPL